MDWTHVLDRIKSGEDERNELIANCLLVRGYMENRGRGLPIIRQEMAAFNRTQPGLLNSSEGGFVRLTLWLDSDRPAGA